MNTLAEDMKPFHQLLLNALIVAVTNNFVWFALTFWAYLGTKTVIATSIVSGMFLIAITATGFWFGSIVDHHKKKSVMMFSSAITAALYGLGLLFYVSQPVNVFNSVSSFSFWIFVFILMSGVIAGSIYSIAVPTLITVLVPEDKRDRANGLYGTVMGISFAITSVASGLVLAYGGMVLVLMSAMVFTVISMLFLLFIPIPEKKVINGHHDAPKKIDVKGTILAIRGIPGMFGLIFFNTFNNFLGGVFMALMDAYGLTLVKVEVWGILWGFLSLGFIVGGLIVAKRGLGKHPLRTLFRANIVMWIATIFFTVQPSIALLVAGVLVWMTLVPTIEATEQTVIQKVVPPERQGRVFGFAQSVEQAAAPFTAFLIGPIAQYTTIPFMTDGAGVKLIGSWYGTGTGRGIGLIFTIFGIIGLIVTVYAMRSRSYKLLTKEYEK